MVSTADQLASNAGVDALERGGSAADAMVAAASVMAVVGPHLCGLGGDVLAMVSEPGCDPLALLSIGRAGSGVNPATLRAAGHDTMPLRGDLSSAPVPGAVDGWLALHDRYGRLPREQVFSRAIELAERGFTASLLLSMASHLIHGVAGAEELCPDGPVDLEATVRLPGIARTLRTIAKDGRDGFYLGEFGRELVRVGDGIYAEKDLTDSLAQWCDPLALGVWDHDLWTVPAPSQGYLTLASSFIAEHLGLGEDPSDPRWAHLVVEASRAAGHDRPAVLFDGAEGVSLLDPDRLCWVAARVRDHEAAAPDVDVTTGNRRSDAQLVADGDTTHLCAIDAEGLGISLTQSNALDFGSHVVAGSTGVFLHNRGVGFSLVEGHPAELGPGRRPPHTLSPMLVTKDGALTHLAGAMGGDAQPQVLLQLLARMLRAGEDPATAITAGRLSLSAPATEPFRLWWGDLTVCLESNAPRRWADGLAERGHRIQLLSAFDPTAVGCAQIITVVGEGDDRHYVGATDPRSPEGHAATR
ncbi:MAG: gamma-glutamyltransferase [Acidimicrobiales bacterium]